MVLMTEGELSTALSLFLVPALLAALAARWIEATGTMVAMLIEHGHRCSSPSALCSLFLQRNSNLCNTYKNQHFTSIYRVYGSIASYRLYQLRSPILDINKLTRLNFVNFTDLPQKPNQLIFTELSS